MTRSAARLPRVVLAAAFLGAAVGAAVGARGDEPAASRSLIVERPETDVFLLAVRLDQSVLAEALTTFQEHGAILLPVGEIGRLLGLAITIDVARGAASGFLLKENRTFDLDVTLGRVVVAGKTLRFDSAGVEVHQDDIYADAALLAEWLPVNLDIDRYASVLTVRPREPLPLQLRLERERRLERSRPPGPAGPRLPRTEVPYRLADGPFIDQSVRLLLQPLPEGGSRAAASYSTYVTGDLLFAEASAFIGGSEHGISDARFTLSRKSPDAELLGPLKAREVTVGDVFHPGLDLIALPRSGTGFLVSSFPLFLPTEFDRQTFRGDLPPGWEVELYRGDELLAYARSRADGLYEFLDVPLLFGLNSFRLELYGPQGQRRTESRPLNVGETLTPAGQLYYRLAGNDPSLRLAGPAPLDARRRGSFELSYGLARNLSGSASLTTIELADGRHTYGKAGLRGFWGFLFANLDAAKDIEGGSVVQATLQSRIGAFGFLAQHAQLQNFVSESFLTGAQLRSRTRFRLNTAIPATFLPRLPVILELRHDRQLTGPDVTEVTGRISAFRRGLSVANQIQWSFTSGEGSGPSTAIGQFLVSRFFGRFSLRGEIDYELKPLRDVTSAAVTAETWLVKNYLLSAEINRALREQRTRYQIGVSKLEGAFGYGATAEYSNPGGLGASLLLSVGIGRVASIQRWHTQARPLAGSGGLAGRVFLDSNGNGLMDAGEAPIEGAGFLLNGGGTSALTDAKGNVFLPNLPPYQSLNVSLATSTLEDPFWRAAQEGVRFVPRPGKVVKVDFPVLVSGEITGTVFVRGGGTSRAESGATLELVDASGVVVKKAVTAYDGFYDVTDIRPGRYTLRVARDQGRAPGGGLAPVSPRDVAGPVPPSRDVVMAPGGTVLDGVDFVIGPAPFDAVLPATQTAAAAALPAPPIRLAPPPDASTSVPTALSTSKLHAPRNSYAVHFSSYRERYKAVRDAAQYASQLGRQTRVRRVDLKTKGIWYRVLVGDFATIAEARAYREELIRLSVPDVGLVYRVQEERKEKRAGP